MAKLRFSHFIVSRLTKREATKGIATERMLHFTVIGIALCVAVMLLTIFIGNGFRHEVQARLALISGDLKIAPLEQENNATKPTFIFTEAMKQQLLCCSYVKSVRTVLQQPAMLKTDSAFCGVIALGFDNKNLSKLYNTLSFREKWNSSIPLPTRPIVVSSTVAHNLNLKVGSKVPLYTLGNKLSVRQATVIGVSDIPEVAGGVVTMPIMDLKNQIATAPNEISYVEVFLDESINTEQAADRLVEELSKTNFAQSQRLGVNTSREVMPALYDWIDMLDGNTLLLLCIMAIVAGFTAITGILVMILGRTRMIGLLKALGTPQTTLRTVFLVLGGNIVLRGLLWGNLIAFTIAFTEWKFRFIALDPTNYYISYVPIRVTVIPWITVNISTFVIVLLMLYLPTRIISHIKPAETIRFS